LESEKVLITAALPYSNDRLHLGHLRSTYIPADIYYRYLKKKGVKAIYICATDEHGTPIAVKAEREGVSPKQIADYYHKLIREDLEGVECSFSFFSRTTDPLHYQVTQSFFLKLLQSGYIYEQEIEQLKCPKCNRFLPDRYVEGTCPHCGYEGARGDACESCGRYLRPTELINPHCTICGSKPILVKSKHWFFKLSAFQDRLREWLTNNKSLPDNVKNYALKWIEEGLRDWDITRDMSWGVPIPQAEPNKVIYVWFDAPIGYISSTMRWAIENNSPDSWKDYWLRGSDAKVIHFIGKDIIYHHALFWVAMLMAHGDFHLPHSIIAGEYLTLEGRKMSKSRGWYIGIADYLKLMDPDPLRYYLISAAPLDKDADFSWEDFIRRYNDELVDTLSNFIHRTLTLIERSFNSTVPDPSEFSNIDEEVLNKVKQLTALYDSALSSYRFRDALNLVMEIAHLGNKYLNENAPWSLLKTDQERAATVLYVCVQMIKTIASLIQPFMPSTSERIWKLLGLEGSPEEELLVDACKPIPPGRKIGQVSPIFKRISSERAKELKQMLLQHKS